MVEEDMIFDEQIFLSTLSLRRATDTESAQDRPKEFLSTLSLRRATQTQSLKIPAHSDFYPRSPCGERPNLQQNQHQRKRISIHALLAESDREREAALSQSAAFLSTLSLRRATVISGSRYRRTFYFYPRSPCGERL